MNWKSPESLAQRVVRCTSRAISSMQTDRLFHFLYASSWQRGRQSQLAPDHTDFPVPTVASIPHAACQVNIQKRLHLPSLLTHNCHNVNNRSLLSSSAAHTSGILSITWAPPYPDSPSSCSQRSDSDLTDDDRHC